jgi:hypothetical protein
MLMLCTCTLGVRGRRSSHPQRVNNEATRSIKNENAGTALVSRSGPARFPPVPTRTAPIVVQ